jgi:hypothetical protein
MSAWAYGETPVTSAKMNQKTVLIDTGTNIASATTYPGQLAYCTVTGSGFIAGIMYQRNVANTAWVIFGNSWAALTGKPYYMVTPAGPTDGGDYGPNTPGTSTGGIQEALNQVNSDGGGAIWIKKGIYATTTQINLPSVAPLSILSEGGVIAPSSSSIDGFDIPTFNYSTGFAPGGGHATVEPFGLMQGVTVKGANIGFNFNGTYRFMLRNCSALECVYGERNASTDRILHIGCILDNSVNGGSSLSGAIQSEYDMCGWNGGSGPALILSNSCLQIKVQNSTIDYVDGNISSSHFITDDGTANQCMFTSVDFHGAGTHFSGFSRLNQNTITGMVIYLSTENPNSSTGGIGPLIAGWQIAQPALPSGVGSTHANTNNRLTTVWIFQTGGSQTHIIDPAGTDITLPADPTFFPLSPGAKVYWGIAVPTSWHWYSTEGQN